MAAREGRIIEEATAGRARTRGDVGCWVVLAAGPQGTGAIGGSEVTGPQGAGAIGGSEAAWSQALRATTQATGAMPQAMGATP